MANNLIKVLGELQTELLGLSQKVESSVINAITSVTHKIPELADEVIKADAFIDQLEVKIEERCNEVLALFQPVASDLRVILGILKVNNDLERIGDLAVNISKRSKTTNSHMLDDREAIQILENMGKLVVEMVNECIHSFIHRDSERARKVLDMDNQLDHHNKRVYRIFIESSDKNPVEIEPLLAFTSISRNLERMGDYATNIAEDVMYMVDGKIVRHTYRRA